MEDSLASILVEQLDSLLADDIVTIDFSDFSDFTPPASVWWQSEVLPVELPPVDLDWIDAGNASEPGTQQLAHVPPGEIHWVA
jgi:hypothetical protein